MRIEEYSACRKIKVKLAKCVVEMIVTADDMGYAAVVIVNNNGEHVCRRSVRSKNNEIVELFVCDGDATLNMVLDCCRAVNGIFTLTTKGTPSGASSGSRSRHRRS